MTQPPETPTWLLWIVPAGTVIAALWAFLRRFFAMATREELKQSVVEVKDDMNTRHQENRADTAEIKKELGELKTLVARIEGQLSGRYPNLPGKR